MYNYLLFDIVYGHPPCYLDGCSYVFRVYLCKMYVIVRVRTSKQCVSCAVDLMFCLFVFIAMCQFVMILFHCLQSNIREQEGVAQCWFEKSILFSASVATRRFEEGAELLQQTRCSSSFQNGIHGDKTVNKQAHVHGSVLSPDHSMASDRPQAKLYHITLQHGQPEPSKSSSSISSSICPPVTRLLVGDMVSNASPISTLSSESCNLCFIVF